MRPTLELLEPRLIEHIVDDAMTVLTTLGSGLSYALKTQRVLAEIER